MALPGQGRGGRLVALSRVEEGASVSRLEGFVENFEDPTEKITVLHNRIDCMFSKLDRIMERITELENVRKPKTRWEKLLTWW